ncbi:hypothetical protein, partial [Holospora elegans]|uniref:hypothetical protein n=1 Tax=Holospora elegans TaxID=431043 RepID=UPI0019D32678
MKTPEIILIKIIWNTLQTAFLQYLTNTSSINDPKSNPNTNFSFFEQKENKIKESEEFRNFIQNLRISLEPVFEESDLKILKT